MNGVVAEVSLFQQLRGVLPDTAAIAPNGHLTLGGSDVVALAEQYGTPLYVYDEATIRHRATALVRSLANAYGGKSLVCYAAKAYCAPWIVRLVTDMGLGLDVVSGGELFVGLHAGMPAERIYFHGNNKGLDEIEYAVEAGIGRFVLDNLEEIERLGNVATRRGIRQSILLRVTPGVEAHTHEYIKTGIHDTKFGFSISAGLAEQAVRAVQSQPSLDLVGFHAHIGSQIFDLEPYRESIRRLVQFAASMRHRYNVDVRELSPGGGFGMRYTPNDAPHSLEEVMCALGQSLVGALVDAGFERDALPCVSVEPGRSLVGPAGAAVYRVGSIKDIPGIRTYVAVDGGMADNIRPTTYGAVYSALLANRAGEAPEQVVALAGKYCESGDVLIREAYLPSPCVDDLVVVPGSGAYNLAMASNYNMALRPAVVVVQDGSARLVQRRERYADLLRLAQP